MEPEDLAFPNETESFEKEESPSISGRIPIEVEPFDDASDLTTTASNPHSGTSTSTSAPQVQEGYFNRPGWVKTIENAMRKKGQVWVEDNWPEKALAYYKNFKASQKFKGLAPPDFEPTPAFKTKFMNSRKTRRRRAANRKGRNRRSRKA